MSEVWKFEIQPQFHKCEKQLIFWIKFGGVTSIMHTFGAPVIQVVDCWTEKLKECLENWIGNEACIKSHQGVTGLDVLN